MVRLSDFDYHLPNELIAQTPLADRAASRLLHLDRESGAVHHGDFRQVVDYLHEGDLLVMNNTRVNAWRFIGQKSSGATIEILALNETEPGIFDCLVKPAKRMKPGVVVELGLGLTAEVISESEDVVRQVRISHPDSEIYPLMKSVGSVPLPPYIKESIEDPERYQTVVSKHPGSAAAPTAGLHFTPEILEQAQKKGVKVVYVTLHVGIDTFRPIQVDDVSFHKMHGEVCEILPDVAEVINTASGRIIAVGTTSVRTLETFATGHKTVGHGRSTSSLFIKPGFTFQVVDGMFTNFHLPKTTMLLMISALSSRERILTAYDMAVRAKYRFLSFGDSMLIL